MHQVRTVSHYQQRATPPPPPQRAELGGVLDTDSGIHIMLTGTYALGSSSYRLDLHGRIFKDIAPWTDYTPDYWIVARPAGAAAWELGGPVLLQEGDSFGEQFGLYYEGDVSMEVFSDGGLIELHVYPAADFTREQVKADDGRQALARSVPFDPGSADLVRKGIQEPPDAAGGGLFDSVTDAAGDAAAGLTEFTGEMRGLLKTAATVAVIGSGLYVGMPLLRGLRESAGDDDAE